MDRINPITVFCDHCKANPGNHCVTKSGKACSTHKVRIEAAGFLPEVEPETVYIPEQAESPEETVSAEFASGPVSEPELVQEPAQETPQAWNPKQAFHVVSNKNLGLRVREPFSYLNGEVKDMERHMLKHETRAYLEQNMPCKFVVSSNDNLKQVLRDLNDGVEIHGSNSSFSGEAFTGFVKDGSGATVIYTPRGSGLTFKDIGIRSMVAKPTDIGKFMKYLKRLLAMYVHSQNGHSQTFVDAHDNGPTLLYQAGDQEFRIRYDSPLPQQRSKKTGKLVDFKIEGCAYVTKRWANAHLGLNPDTGRKWDLGDCARITFTCKKFMWKGHVMVIRMKNVDATFWDCKKIIGTEEVFVGFMGTLHAGKLHLGLQELVDWGMLDYARQIGKLAITDFADQLNDPDYGRKKLLEIARDRIQDLEDPESKFSQQVSRWRMLNAIHHGFEYEHEPFLIRDAFSYFERDVLDVANGRILVPKNHGFRAYYFIDPWCINDDGVFDPRRARLQGNCVYSPKLKAGTQAITFRNPHTIHEYQVIQAVGPYGNVDLVSDQVMIISFDIAMDFAEAQGGGDYDDCGNVYYASEVVDHFLNRLPKYPAKLPAAVYQKVADFMQNNFLMRRFGLNLVKFDKQALIDKIREVENADAGVGMIDNYLRVRMALSLYYDPIMDQLNDKIAAYQVQGEDPAHLVKARDWLKSYDRYGENAIASAYEDTIDSIVMNGAKGGVQVGIGKQIREFWNSCLVVPYWATVGGHEGRGRIPARCLENNPVIINDPISECLLDLRQLVEDLRDFMNAKQWLGLQMAPREVRNYPVTEEVIEAVDKGQAAWKLAMTTRQQEQISRKESYKSFLEICQQHRKALDAKDFQFRMMFMAELERRVYDGPYGSPRMFNGRPTSGPDAYINNPLYFPLRLQLHQELGLKKVLAIDNSLNSNQNNTASADPVSLAVPTTGKYEYQDYQDYLAAIEADLAEIAGENQIPDTLLA